MPGGAKLFGNAEAKGPDMPGGAMVDTEALGRAPTDGDADDDVDADADAGAGAGAD